MSMFDNGIEQQLSMVGDSIIAIIDQATIKFSGIIEPNTVMKTTKSGNQVAALETTLTVSSATGDLLKKDTIIQKRGHTWKVREALFIQDFALSQFALVEVM